jgi:hypothetical protein
MTLSMIFKFKIDREEALYKETNFVKECETEKKIMVDKYERIVSEL